MSYEWPTLGEDPAFYDPTLNKYRHPELPCGNNSFAMNGDEANGAGVNEPQWPLLYDTFDGMTPLIVTAEMMDNFDTECPDVTIGAQSDTVTIRRTVTSITVGSD